MVNAEILIASFLKHIDFVFKFDDRHEAYTHFTCFHTGGASAWISDGIACTSLLVNTGR